MRSIQRYLPVVARLLLGLVFTVFGLNGFFGFLPQPPLTDAGGAFLGALAATGYMFPLIKGTEVVTGLLLLSGRLTPFALILLAPITVNIVAFHAFLSPGLALPLIVLGAHLYLAYAHRAAYRSLFQLQNRPILEGSPRWTPSTHGRQPLSPRA